MQEETSASELQGRLALIESMIAEGRRSTESWGWAFVFWGLAYYVAMAWSRWGNQTLAWPVTMTVASLLMIALGRRRKRARQAPTTAGRAIASVWIAVGISMFALLLALGLSHLLEERIFMSIVAAMMGTANAASAMILRWKPQFACTLVWWATCVVCAAGSDAQSTDALIVAVFLCQIVFGIYVMLRKTGERKAAHA
jgi:hypothetical protein